MCQVIPMRLTIPAPRLAHVDRFAMYYGEDCEKPADLVLPVACRGIDSYLGDFERLIATAPTKADALELHHILSDYANRVLALQSRALRAAEAFDFQKGA